MSEFKNISELIIALRNYEKKGIVDSRFVEKNGSVELKAPSGQSELVAVDGGWLLGGEIIAPIQHAIAQKSALFSKASKFYSSSPRVNEGLIPFVNETHRTNSAFQLKTYWLAEGEEKTVAKYTLGLATCKLNKLYALMVVTDELWSDAAGLESALDQFISDPSEGSLVWQIERAMLMGDGSSSGGMYGIMGPDTNGTISVAQADPLDETTLNAFNDALAPATHKTSEWYMSEENYIELQAINFTNENDKYYKDGDLYIYGKKVNVVEQMVTPYDLMLGDVSQYAVALKAGPLVEKAISLHLKLLTDEKVIRWGIRINGKSFGSAYDLDDGTSVGTFVVSATTPAEESSSSSSVDSSSSSSSSNSSSSNSSTSSVDSHSSESSSSESSDSSSSLSSASSGSTSSSSSTDLSVSSSSSQSSALVGPCEEFYTASGFTGDTSLNGVYDVVGRHNSKAYYSNAAGTRFLFWSSTFSLWALAAAVGAAPANWLSNSATGTACPNGSYLDVSGTIA